MTDFDEIPPIIAGSDGDKVLFEEIEETGVLTKSIKEERRRVGQLTANEEVTWSLIGDDAEKFVIDGDGVLKFRKNPDYETPSSVLGTNDYSVIVKATDLAKNESTQEINVSILNDTHRGEVSKEKLTIGENTFEIAIKGGQLGKDIETNDDHKFEIQADTDTKIKAEEKDKINADLNKKALEFKIEVPKIKKTGEVVTGEADINPEDLAPQKATVALPLELLIDDDKPLEVDQKLSYHGLKEKDDGSGEFEIIDMTYDSSTKTGARFFDTGNDGIADYVHIGLVDGGHGDKDGEVNGEIDDPSTFGSITMDAQWTQIVKEPQVIEIDPTDGTEIIIPPTYFDNILKLVDENNPLATANHVVSANLDQSSLTKTVDEIGYVVSAIGENITLELIKDTGNILYSTLENNDVTSLDSDVGLQSILLGNDQQISFYSVKDASIDLDLTDLNDQKFEFFNFTEDDLGADEATLSTESGLKLSLTESSAQSITDLIGNLQVTGAPILDFSSLPDFMSGPLTVSVELAREADYDTIVGFYNVVDEIGSVRDSLTGDIISPGDSNYSNVALENIVEGLTDLKVADNNTDTISRTFESTGLVAPFVEVQDTNEIYFAFDSANSDSIKHIKTLGLNTFGLEDTQGGGDLDYDDLIFKFDNFVLGAE